MRKKNFPRENLTKISIFGKHSPNFDITIFKKKKPCGRQPIQDQKELAK